jgi:hypothetical protein
MRVGIVTLMTTANIGNRLQNFALQQTLTEHGIDCDTLLNTDCYSDYFERHGLLHTVKMLLNLNEYRLRYLRLRAFNAFNRRFIKVRKVNSESIRNTVDKDYDYIIAGSDQIWNPYYSNNLSIEFLSFVETSKRIAYAASFGVAQIPKSRQDEFVYGLKGFKCISVREKQASLIVKKLIGREPHVTLDPTLLLSTNEWTRIEKKPKNFPDGDYVLTYYIGQSDKALSIIIANEANSNGIHVLKLLSFEDKRYYTIAPDEFIYCIKRARKVYTDSFHATLFSILFGIPVIVCQHRDQYLPTNSRLDNLLNLFGFPEILGQRDYVSIPSIMNAEEIITTYKNQSVHFLLSALGVLDEV